jgi:hypothetical protein
VIAHAVGKKDDAHAGLAYQEVRRRLDEQEPDGMEPSKEPDGEAADNSELSVFDEPSPDRQTDTADPTAATNHADTSWPVKGGQTVSGADGNTYRTDAGDRVVVSPDTSDAIALSAGETLETTDGSHIQTEQGDYLA